MDSAIKTTKPASNISDIVHRFAKVCRLRSIGVFANGNLDDIPSIEGASDSTGETSNENDYQKIHPQPIEENPTKNHLEVEAVTAISNVFSTLSSLKSAYIQLQEAHIPYDPQKIQSADKQVISELKSLSEIKQSYKEKQNVETTAKDSFLFAEIKEYEILLEKLQGQVEARDEQIRKLRQEVEELDRQNADLEDKIKQRRSSEEESIESILPLGDPTSTLFSKVFELASKSIHDFAKPLIALMKASGWDLDQAAYSIDTSVVYTRRADKKYAFETYLCRKMFGREAQPVEFVDDDNSISRHRDPFDALIEHPNSNFAKFCQWKYLSVIHPSMERSFFGNLDQRAFVLSDGHPRTPVYQAFVKMCKWIWVLRTMAVAFNPSAEMFWARKGSQFSKDSMESVVKDASGVAEGGGNLKVGLIVMPGFRIGKTIIRCRVYLSRTHLEE